MANIIFKELENDKFEVFIDDEKTEYTITKGTKNWFAWKNGTQIFYDRDLGVVSDKVKSEVQKIVDKRDHEAKKKAFFENFKPEIIEVTNPEQFKFLYDNWAMTWEGLIEEDWITAMKMCGAIGVKGYHILGKNMNKHYHLRGNNRYPEDLHIFAIYPFEGIAMIHGARWFTDIVDNNKRRNK